MPAGAKQLEYFVKRFTIIHEFSVVGVAYDTGMPRVFLGTSRYTRRKDGAKAPSLLDHLGHFGPKAQ